MIEHSGLVAVLGRSNAGKSTLVNALVGHKVAIVSPRVQTTRSRIMGVLHGPGMQMVFVDTPGMHTARTRLGEFMVKQAWGGLDGIDACLLVVDATMGFGEMEHDILRRMIRTRMPIFCAVNKTDAVSRQALFDVLATTPGDAFCEVVPISALAGDNLDLLRDLLCQAMPEGPAYFPEEYYTDQPQRRMAAELIREAALNLLRDEIPHGIGVDITKIEDRREEPEAQESAEKESAARANAAQERVGHENAAREPIAKGNTAHEPAARQNTAKPQRPHRPFVRVEANLLVERPTHKGMVIGAGGSMLRQIGTQARQGLEELFGAQTHLQLYVRVQPNWRESVGLLREMEYE